MLLPRFAIFCIFSPLAVIIIPWFVTQSAVAAKATPAPAVAGAGHSAPRIEDDTGSPDSSYPSWDPDNRIMFFRDVFGFGYPADEDRRRWFRQRLPLLRLGRRLLRPPVRTCDQLVPALRGHPITVPIYNQIFGHFLDCIEISLFHVGQPPRQVPFDTDHIARDVYRNLDAGSVPWRLGRRLHRSGSFRLTEVPFDRIQFDDGALRMFLHKRLYMIWFNGGSDFIGNGKMQIYATWSDPSLMSSDYHEASILLVRTRPGGPIVAQPIPLRRPPGFTPPPAGAPKAQ